MKYRIGRKQKSVLLDENGLEVAMFRKGKEDIAELVCYILNNDTENKGKFLFEKNLDRLIAEREQKYTPVQLLPIICVK